MSLVAHFMVRLTDKESEEYVSLYGIEPNDMDSVIKIFNYIRYNMEFFYVKPFSPLEYYPFNKSDKLYQFITEQGIEYIKDEETYRKIASFDNSSIIAVDGTVINLIENYFTDKAVFINKNGERIPIKQKGL